MIDDWDEQRSTGRPEHLVGFGDEFDERPPAEDHGGWAASAEPVRKATRPLLVIGAVLVTVVVLGFGIALYQLHAMRGQLREVQSTTGEAQKAVAATDRAAEASQSAAAEAQKAAAQSEQTAQAAKQAAETAKEATQSAQQATQTAQQATQTAQQAVVAGQRAQVMVADVAVRRIAGPGFAYWTAAPVAQNTGNTPTRDLRFLEAWGLKKPKPRPAPLLSDAQAAKKRFLPATIAPHAGIDLPGPTLLPRAAGKTLYLHGLIYYNDTLTDDRHVTQFCYFVHMPRLVLKRERDLPPKFQRCPDDNCTDKECSAPAQAAN